jgi:gluconolactonase
MVFARICLLILLAVLVGSCSQSPAGNGQWHLVAEGFEFPEGPAWDNHGALYVSSCFGGRISRIKDGQVETFLTASDDTFSKTNGLFVLDNGDILACDFGKGAILQISPDRQVKVLIAGYQAVPFNRPNDIIATANGNIYFTDPKTNDRDKIDGRLFYYNSKSGKLQLIADGLAFPNGLGISPLDGRLYVAESAKARIIRFGIADDGTVRDKETFVELPGGDPDGMDFDVRGNLYVAHFGTGAVYVISPDGKVLQTIPTPGKQPSNVEFGGTDFRTLYLTEDVTNCLYKIQVCFPGCRFSR